VQLCMFKLPAPLAAEADFTQWVNAKVEPKTINLICSSTGSMQRVFNSAQYFSILAQDLLVSTLPLKRASYFSQPGMYKSLVQVANLYHSFKCKET